MNTSFDSVRQALENRLMLVADRDFFTRDPAGHLAALQEAAQVLDAAVAALPETTDPRLLHFLERQSYVKALDFLHQISGTAEQ